VKRSDTVGPVAERDLTGVADQGDGHAKRAAAAHGLRAVDEQIFQGNLQQAGSAPIWWRGPLDLHIHFLEGGIATEQIGHALHQAGKFDWHRLRLRRPGEQQEILHQLAEPVDPLPMMASSDDSTMAARKLPG
jgi:hypothetical protein